MSESDYNKPLEKEPKKPKIPPKQPWPEPSHNDGTAYKKVKDKDNKEKSN